MSKNNIISSSLWVVIIILLSKFFGFVREALVAAFYGAGWETDAFYLAQSIPTVIFSFIISILGIVILPMYTDKMVNKGENIANDFINKILHIIIIISLLISAFGMIFSEKLVNIFSPSFSAQSTQLAIILTKLSFLPLVILGITHTFCTILNANKSFIGARIVGIPQSICMIISMIIFSRQIGIYSLVIGSIAGNLITLIIIIYMLKPYYCYKLKFEISKEDKDTIRKLIFPVIIGSCVIQFNSVIDKMIASGLVEGSISALNYSEKLTSFLTGAWNLAIVTVMFSYIATAYAKKDTDKLKEYLTTSLIMIFSVCAPITIIVTLFSKEIVTIIFGRGNFNEEAIALTSLALICYCPSMLAYGIRDMLTRFLYATQDTKTPMVNSAICVLINVILNIVLVKFLGVGGIALATSISVIVSCILLSNALKIKGINLFENNIGNSFSKIVIAAIIAGIVGRSIHRVLEWTQIYMVISISISVIIYIMCINLFKVKEVNMLTNMVLGKMIKIRRK